MDKENRLGEAGCNFKNIFETTGSFLESHSNYPQKINVNFVLKRADNHFLVRTYERGSGPTMACGTGASASFAWLSRLGVTKGRTQIDVPSGTLYFEYADEDILMTGPSEVSFAGSFVL